MFLKKRRFLFPSIFENKKGWKLQKKKEFKKKSMKHKRDFWWESVSFVFLCYCTWGWSTTRPCSGQHLKENCFWKENYSDKKRLTEKWKQLRRRCILPCTLIFYFFPWGSEGAGASWSPRRAGGSWLRSLFDPSHTSLPRPPFLSLSPSLSRPVSLTL